MSGAGQGIDVGAAGAGGGDPPTNFNGGRKYLSAPPPRIGEKFSVDVILREFETKSKIFSRFRRDFPKTTEFTPEFREKSGIF